MISEVSDERPDHGRHDAIHCGEPGEQDGGGDAGGDDEHAEPAADRPGGAFLDDDAGPRVPDRSRLGLAVLLDVLAHDSSSWSAISIVIARGRRHRQHTCE